jgi:hypothetical protein
MEATPMFASAPARRGMYESFYLRAVSHDEPVGVWIRHTVDKPPGRPPRGSLWCTVFDAARERPFMHKLSSDSLRVPDGEWIEVGDRGSGEQGAAMGGRSADGACGGASWSLRIEELEPELRHLALEWLYRAPLPRTKLTSPSPLASFSGELSLSGDRRLALDGWRGMVGHNWGAEHAERWIWTNGTGFDSDGEAYLDAAIGRIKLGPLTTPWIGNGVLFADGELHRLGGLERTRSTVVRETPQGAQLVLPAKGVTVSGRVGAEQERFVGWKYADPDGGGHDVVNCSIASMTLRVERDGRPPLDLHTEHGATFELGMREIDHGVPVQPFPDGWIV